MKSFIFALILTTTNAYFVYYTPDSYPDSWRDYVLCGLRNPGLACDPNRLMGNYTIEDIDIALKNVQYSTNCSCENQDLCDRNFRGFTVSLAVLEKISDSDGASTSTEHRLKLAQIFADALRNHQMRDQCNDDVLIVISKDDNVIYTSVGATAGKYLTPEVIQKTDKKILSKLENQQFFEAMSEMILIYQDVLQGKPLTEVFEEKHWYSPLPLWAVYAIGGAILLFFVLLTAFIAYCIFRRKRRSEYSVGRVNYNTRM